MKNRKHSGKPMPRRLAFKIYERLSFLHEFHAAVHRLGIGHPKQEHIDMIIQEMGISKRAFDKGIKGCTYNTDQIKRCLDSVNSDIYHHKALDWSRYKVGPRYRQTDQYKEFQELKKQYLLIKTTCELINDHIPST